MAHQYEKYDEKTLRLLIEINREAIRKLQADLERYINFLELVVLKRNDAPKIFNRKSSHPPLPPESPVDS